MVARPTGGAARARTVALAALVGSQLGQTLAVGGHADVRLHRLAAAAAGADFGRQRFSRGDRREAIASMPTCPR